MKHSPFRRRIAGIAAITAALLLLVSCGSKSGSAGSTSAPAAATPSPTAAAVKSWTAPPEMKIDKNKSYSAKINTSKGSFTIELFAKDAPNTVNNFVFLSREHFYDGVPFHRIIETFMIQTGDPTGTGRGGPGYKFDHEPTSYTYDKGIVAMANSGINTNGSQFFIVTGNASHLNAEPIYTVFGKVSDGMDTVMSIAKTPVGANGSMSAPKEKVTIDSIEIVEK